MMRSTDERRHYRAALVIRACRLMEYLDPDHWLERYDAALASEDYLLLEIFCFEAAAALGQSDAGPKGQSAGRGPASRGVHAGARIAVAFWDE